MTVLNIALLQLLPGKNIDENINKGTAACRKAKAMGADIALFPEMWNVGYAIPEDINLLKSTAVAENSPYTRIFSDLAQELDMAIGITYLEEYSPLPRNTVTLFDRHGKKIYTYAKVHTCDFGDECRLYPGEDFYVEDLDTAKGAVKVGSMICYDREFPESARILMLKGAELILVPNACPMEINRISQLRGRAYENMLAIATCNYPAPHPDCNGGSSVFDGVVYVPGLPGSRDTCILQAGREEGIFMASLDLDMLRDYRNREVHGNAYRRPDRYGILTDDEIKEPFVREKIKRD